MFAKYLTNVDMTAFLKFPKGRPKHDYRWRYSVFPFTINKNKKNNSKEKRMN